MIKLFSVLGLLVIMLFAIENMIHRNPRFKVNECAQTILPPSQVKILSIANKYYNFCVLRDNECGKSHEMKINDFDRVFSKIKCEVKNE